MLKLNNLLNSVKQGEDESQTKAGKDDSLDNSKKRSLTEKTELEILVERRSYEVRKKALHHWSLLRDSVCTVKKAVEEAEQKDLVLTHGIHRERKLNHTRNITQVLFLPKQREYLTCDGQNFRFFMEDGRKKDVIPTEEGINRLIYSSQTDQFVGWMHGQQSLYLMSKDFVITSQSNAVGKVLLSAYNSNTGEFITVGPHFITCWSFRYGARHLIPRKTTKTKFGEKKMFVMMVLEETASRSQRMFFGQRNGVVVYNVFSGLEITHKKELHAQPITALTFFNPLKYVITGARDGCIKIWDSNWKVKMVFVGHNDQVNFLSIYPHGPAFISASLDCTIRVWNMETCDEVDKTVISEHIEGMGTEMNYNIFYTQAGKHVDLWKLEHIYQIHTNIGYRVNNIKVTTHPTCSQRAVLMCRDSSIRIVCPTNGEVLTTLLMNSTDGLVDAAYAINENVIFTVLGCGDIIKARTDVNPCQVLCRWKCNDIQEMCNYLLVYEYVVDPTASGDIWAMMKRSVQTRTVQQAASSNMNRTLLLGGRKDGYICVFDWNSGDVTFKVEAHGSKGVLNMIANSKSDQLISAGMDNIIKVWRLYPFAEEALAPLMSFYCAHTPSFMTTIKTSLGVAFQDPSTATFSVVLYSLPEKTFAADNPQLEGFQNRNDHKPDDDHMDLITGLTSCPRMKLYASCSMDGTIRIWSEDNVLIRLIRINTIPNSLAFCSHKGDLLVGLGNHLFYISHKKYLPKHFIMRQACMKFSPDKEEDPLVYDENCLNKMDKNDVKRLKNSHASFKFTHFVDILSPEEEEEVMKEKKTREEAFSLLEIRENELQLIRDGDLNPKPKRKPTKRTQMRAFKEYMKMYYNKEPEVLPKEEDIVSKYESEEVEEEGEEKFRPETAPFGFFSDLSQKSPTEDNLFVSPQHPCYPSGPSGYLPNSVLIKILYPPPVTPMENKDATPYRPPELNTQQLGEIHSLYDRKPSRRDSEFDTGGISRTVTFAADEHLSRVLELDLSDDEGEKEKSEIMAPDEGVLVDFDDVVRKGQVQSSADGTSSGAATIATPARSSAMTIRTFSDMPGTDSRPLTTPKSPQKSRLSRKKKTSFLEDEEDDDEISMLGLSQASTSLMSKFQDILDKPPSDTIMESEIETEAAAEEEIKVVVKKPQAPSHKEVLQRLKLPPRVAEKATLTEDNHDEVEPTPPPVEPITRKPQTLSKPITKYISRPKPKARTPTPPRSPTPPPPATPLPNFIKQFVGTEWFDKYFPNCNENTMPKPWTSDTFVNMIVKLLRIAEWLHKVSVSDAIVYIHTAEGLSDMVVRNVVKTLLAVLNHHTSPPSCNVVDQKNFILAALKALCVFCIKEKDVLAEMMVQFLDGDKDVRSSVLEVMTTLGLVDPHRQFQKELDSWDIWGIEEKNHQDELHRMSNQWLDRWMASYKLRIKDTMEKLNKGHSLQGRLSNRGSLMPGSRRGSMMPQDLETVTTLPGSDGALAPSGGRGGRVSAMSHGSVTVTLERLQGSSIIDSVTYIDALSYFCEMMMEKELEALRRGELLRRQQGDNVVQAKNTVLVLPKIAHKPALVRLGEMHTSKIRPNRDSDFVMPPIVTKGKQPAPGDMTSFVPCINLPMKPVYLNPFPSSIDEHDAMFRQPILITLKSSQKFFIPSQSYVPFEHNVAVGS